MSLLKILVELCAARKVFLVTDQNSYLKQILKSLGRDYQNTFELSFEKNQVFSVRVFLPGNEA